MPGGGLEGNPLLTILGRRGRGAVIDALRTSPDAQWNIRDVARAADVAPMVAARAIKELAALGVVDTYRPGRDAVVRWRTDTDASRALAAFDPPDVRGRAARVFTDHFAAPRGTAVLRWEDPGDVARDPLTPTRIAILVRDADAEDEALDAIGPALDAVHAAGWPRPEATVFQRGDLEGDEADETARAVRQGTPIGSGTAATTTR